MRSPAIPRPTSLHLNIPDIIRGTPNHIPRFDPSFNSGFGTIHDRYSVNEGQNFKTMIMSYMRLYVIEWETYYVTYISWEINVFRKFGQVRGTPVSYTVLSQSNAPGAWKFPKGGAFIRVIYWPFPPTNLVWHRACYGPYQRVNRLSKHIRFKI